MSGAREEILARIRTVTGNWSGNREQEYAAIQRSYRQRDEGSAARRIEIFVDRLQDYGCGVYYASKDAIAGTIRCVLSERGKRKLVAAAGVPSHWQPEEFEFFPDDDLSYETLDRLEGVLTGCALAIAITGTIVLRHSSREGRRAATLIPDYHLCVVFEEQVFATVPEGIQAMSTFGKLPITTVAGPSATADIEMVRIKGVHGPRTLDVVLVQGGQT